MESVILVDALDRELGLMEKMHAHRTGALHRAFSVLIFNSAGEALLQKRASTKYHSGSLWTNTCCSHPQPGEDILTTVQRRLQYEMGLNVVPHFAYKFVYEAALDNGLFEHELDHVFIGTHDGPPVINKAEVEDWKYVPLADLRTDVAKYPSRYTAWFRLIINHPELDALLV